MKRKLFNLTMKVKSIHSEILQSLGISKSFIRDRSPIHTLLTKAAFHLALAMKEEVSA